MKIIHYNDIWFSIKIDPHPNGYTCYFTVFKIFGITVDGKQIWSKWNEDGLQDPVDDMTKADIFVDGFIKWDGCSNWTFQDQPIHLCGKSCYEDFYELFRRLFQLAKENIPKWDDEASK